MRGMALGVLTGVVVFGMAGCFAGPKPSSYEEWRPGPVRHKAPERVAEMKAERPVPPVAATGSPAKAVGGAEEALAQAGEPAPARPSPGTAARAQGIRRLVIYVARVAVQVTDLEKAAEQVKALAEGLGGYIQLLAEEKVVVRVPAGKFYLFLEKLSGVGEVYDKEIRAQDVTREFLDLELRLKAKLAVLERLKKLLERAQNVKEALAIQKEMGRLVEEIERIKGQLRYFRNLIAFSTVTVRLRRPVERHRILKPPPMRSPFPWVRRLGISPLLGFVRRR